MRGSGGNVLQVSWDHYPALGPEKASRNAEKITWLIMSIFDIIKGDTDYKLLFKTTIFQSPQAFTGDYTPSYSSCVDPSLANCLGVSTRWLKWKMSSLSKQKRF